jgi:hypothetical protein
MRKETALVGSIKDIEKYLYDKYQFVSLSKIGRLRGMRHLDGHWWNMGTTEVTVSQQLKNINRCGYVNWFQRVLNKSHRYILKPRNQLVFLNF